MKWEAWLNDVKFEKSQKCQTSNFQCDYQWTGFSSDCVAAMQMRGAPHGKEHLIHLWHRDLIRIEKHLSLRVKIASFNGSNILTGPSHFWVGVTTMTIFEESIGFPDGSQKHWWPMEVAGDDGWVSKKVHWLIRRVCGSQQSATRHCRRTIALNWK